MTRGEFETICRSISEEFTEPTLSEYKDIEYVYTYYPTISETEGKQQIAYLYLTHGMAIIQDMRHRADINERYEKKMRELRESMKDTEHLMRELKVGKSTI